MAWLIFALGLFVGFLAGVVLDDALDLYRASRKERRMTKPPRRSAASRVARWEGLTPALLALAVLLQLAVGVVMIVERSNRAEYDACTTRWQQDFAAAYQARIASSTEAANALEQVIRAVGAEDPARFRVSIAEYLRLRDTQIRDQKKNPYPPLPDELCGEAS